MKITSDRWSAGTVIVDDISDRTDPMRRLDVHAATLGGCLTVEAARSLRDWLSWWLGGDSGTGPPPPDGVRLAIEQQRTALRNRSAEPVSEDFRAGLAWGERALAEVAAVATPEPVTGLEVRS